MYPNIFPGNLTSLLPDSLLKVKSAGSSFGMMEKQTAMWWGVLVSVRGACREASYEAWVTPVRVAFFGQVYGYEYYSQSLDDFSGRYSLLPIFFCAHFPLSDTN